ncbi:MAG TPA: hypothetical protein VF121_10530, partial [Thermoanaerobaculia bacterium]|nr:hypothetical protein [Thermoanaerobaculia bacterium]
MTTLSAGIVRLALAAAVAGALAAPAAAQERSLYWESLDVDARIDAEGRLHVAERQTYVFTGDWNGGERRFEVGPGERFELQRLSRIDPATGEARPLVQGGLDEVDRYDWVEGRTLRWRSRLPSDPPFDGTRITYLLEYVYDGVVRRDGERYLLRHDFAFPDRGGVIERYRLDLATAPEWRVEGPFRPRFERRDLSPGDGVVVDLALRYAGAGRPAAVLETLPRALRAGACAALLAGLASFLVQFLRGEARLGRFSPPRLEIDRAWIEEHLLSQRPEEIGALWDRRTGPPEVAALIARLVAEGKLASRVEEKRGLFGKPILHLELRVDRSELTSYERALIDKLFASGSDHTDTESIRKRYQSSGFDPAKVIARGIETALRRRFPEEAVGMPRPSRRPTLWLLLGGLACVVLAGIPRLGTALALLVVMAIVYLGPYGIALAGAASWRRRVDGLGRWSLLFLLPLLVLCGLTVALLLFEEIFGRPLNPLLGLAGAAAFVLVPLGLARSVLNMARSRESAQTIERRQHLAAARRWLAGELRRPEPRLDDAWYPYLLALGLERQVGDWFRAFGGAAGATAGVPGSAWSGGGSGSSSGGGWSGGGGAFGGAGGSSAGGVAAGGLSA